MREPELPSAPTPPLPAGMRGAPQRGGGGRGASEGGEGKGEGGTKGGEGRGEEGSERGEERGRGGRGGRGGGVHPPAASGAAATQPRHDASYGCPPLTGGLTGAGPAGSGGCWDRGGGWGERRDGQAGRRQLARAVGENGTHFRGCPGGLTALVLAQAGPWIQVLTFTQAPLTPFTPFPTRAPTWAAPRYA